MSTYTYLSEKEKITYDLEDLENAREGLQVTHVDEESGGGGRSDHSVYSDLGRHPAAAATAGLL